LRKTLDFMPSKRRNKTAATKFFARALEVNGLPRTIVINRSGANTAGINAAYRMLKSFGCRNPIEMARIKYLNNLVERDHRSIRKRIRPMLDFKSFASASATLEGIEVANMIRKGQPTSGLCPFAQFAALAT
jgi:putative transposase